ncbi:hypothetical protein [Mycolicibacterium hippocampi]|uniref:HEAT repeat domain-containing protein n=1 Tax=Mycolicibacterium hippocampi TaxID=659824 RepID=A0A7I9ZG70_9MYCO|nr:hypothetical protein [Mycolicibacterium hippocampi]GFH00015.1 hypothetical protein MHIP_04980 [Mycolicibacterium hippocampi]
MPEMSLVKALNMLADLDRTDPEVLDAIVAVLDPDVVHRAAINLGAACDDGGDPDFWQTLRNGFKERT